MNPQIKFNNSNIPYDWANITFATTLTNDLITGISAIEFEESLEKTKNYGAGNMPRSVSIGNYDASGKITLFMDEVEKIRNVSPNRSLLYVPPFDIIITYLPVDATKAVNVILRNVEFTTEPSSASQNDQNIQVELDLLITHIERK
jgi:hypothetical protein